MLAARAARTGYAADELRTHIESCDACAETTLVASFMNESARQAAAVIHPAPQASAVYWRARIAARQAAIQRAQRPIQMVERLGYASGALVGLGAIVWSWPVLTGIFMRAASNAAVPSAIAAPSGTLIVLGLALLPFLLALPVLHTLRSRV